MQNDETTKSLSYSSTLSKVKTTLSSTSDSIVMMENPVPNEQKQNRAENRNNRGEWSSKLDFMMSCVGFAVGLGNLWRFPYLCYKNGGGAFLIPYFICLIFSGIPVFVLETTLGQMLGQGVLSIWHISPILKGVGYSTVIMTFWMNIYYIVIIAWSLFYLVKSFHFEVPWANCNHSWNTEWCLSDEDIDKYCHNLTLSSHNYDNPNENFTTISHLEFKDKVLNCTTNIQNFTNPVSEFWEREVLRTSKGIEDTGYIQLELAFCLVVSWILCYFTIYKGIRWTGKIVYFTAIFPYICMVILFIRGITLDGALIGLKFYLYPKTDKLFDANVWSDAATQIFYSYGLGLGAWIALSSYNKFHNDVLRDTLIITVINSTTAVFSGCIVFCIIGFMAKQQNKPIENVASSGSGLTFLAYPEATLKMPISPIWAILFFSMMIVLGMGSQFVQLESFFTALIDEFPDVLQNRRQLFISYMICISILIGMVFVTQAGIYWFELFNFYAASGFALLYLIFFEVIAIFWLYGADRYVEKLEFMLQRKVSGFWKICWKYVTPSSCLFIFIFCLIQYKPIQYKNYQYPDWGIQFGWFLALSSMLSVPIYAIIKFIITPGSIGKRWEKLRSNNEEIELIIQQRSLANQA